MGKPRAIFAGLVICSIVGSILLSRYKRAEYEEKRQARLQHDWESILDFNSLESHRIEPIDSQEEFLLRYPYSAEAVGHVEVHEGMMNVSNADADSVYRLLHKTQLQEFTAEQGTGKVQTSLEVTSIRSKSESRGVVAVPAKIKSRTLRESDLLGRGKCIRNQILINNAALNDRGVVVPLVLPEDPVGAGSEWTYEFVPEHLQDEDKARLRAKLSELVRFDGVRAARIDATVDTYMMETLPIALKPGTTSAVVPVVPVRQTIVYYVTIPEVRLLWVQVKAQFSEDSHVISRMQIREADPES